MDVYAYFNNGWEAFAPRHALALALRRMLGLQRAWVTAPIGPGGPG